MMKKGRIFILVMFVGIFGIKQATAQTDTIISTFMQENPRMMKISMLQEETLQMASDGTQMLLVLDISNPQLLLRFVMEGFSIYIDPTSKKKEKYEIKIPSAADLDLEALGLKTERSHNTEEVDEKPNILPLIAPICETGILYTRNNKVICSEGTLFSMYLDVDSDHLYYYILFPIADLMKEKKLAPEWSIGVYASPVDMPNNNEGQMMPPPPMTGEGQGPESFAVEISQWVKFSFEELNSLNLK